MSVDEHEGLLSQIDRWRTYILEHGATEAQVAAIERELRDDVARLRASGLDPDEAFLVALRRVAAGDEVSRGFARAYSD